MPNVFNQAPAPNNVCSRLGVRAAFSSRFRGFMLVPANLRGLIPSQAANVGRWTAFSVWKGVKPNDWPISTTAPKFDS